MTSTKKVIEKVKRCGLCGELKLYEEFPVCGKEFLFHQEGFHSVCFDCLTERIDEHNLDTIDKMCQLLDIPFLPNYWIRLSNRFKDLGVRAILENYIVETRQDKYAEVDWTEQSKYWEKVRECNSVLDELPELKGELYLYLKKKWGDHENFSIEDYMKMEAYEKHTLNYYNFRDEARRDLIRKLALISTLIDKELAEGKTRDVTSMISSYQSLIKESGIQNTISNDTETITSISELMAYLEQNGWMCDYTVTEDRDIVDATIRNMQQYLQRLISDSSEVVHNNYETEKMHMESGTEINEEDLELLLDSENEIEDLEMEESLSANELEEMFNEIARAYGGNKN